MSDSDIDIVTREVDSLRHRCNPQIDFGMLLGKAAQTVDQPLRGEIGRSADSQNAALLTLQEPLGADSDLVQGIADDRQIVASSFGEDQPLPFAMEQLEPQCIFERLHLMAHGALRDVQLHGGTRKAFTPGRSLEGFQAVQGWEATRHWSN